MKENVRAVIDSEALSQILFVIIAESPTYNLKIAERTGKNRAQITPQLAQIERTGLIKIDKPKEGKRKAVILNWSVLSSICYGIIQQEIETDTKRRLVFRRSSLPNKELSPEEYKLKADNFLKQYDDKAIRNIFSSSINRSILSTYYNLLSILLIRTTFRQSYWDFIVRLNLGFTKLDEVSDLVKSKVISEIDGDLINQMLKLSYDIKPFAFSIVDLPVASYNTVIYNLTDEHQKGVQKVPK